MSDSPIAAAVGRIETALILTGLTDDGVAVTTGVSVDDPSTRIVSVLVTLRADLAGDPATRLHHALAGAPGLVEQSTEGRRRHRSTWTGAVPALPSRRPDGRLSVVRTVEIVADPAAYAVTQALPPDYGRDELHEHFAGGFRGDEIGSVLIEGFDTLSDLNDEGAVEVREAFPIGDLDAAAWAVYTEDCRSHGISPWGTWDHLAPGARTRCTEQADVILAAYHLQR